jgi:hypothetical protein
MPLKKGKSKKTISKNIKKEMEQYKKTGKIGTSKPKSKKKAQKQSVAIALSKARESGAKIPKKSKKSVVKESFDKYINLLVKESFGLLKRKVVSEKVEEKEDKDSKSMDMSSESPSITKKERIKITNHIHGNKILGGNIKVDSISKGLWEVGDILDACGFSLDMVTGDMINAPKGNVLLPFRRKAENPFIEGPEIENSRISFSWENLEATPDGYQFKKKYEIIAYLT